MTDGLKAAEQNNIIVYHTCESSVYNMLIAKLRFVGFHADMCAKNDRSMETWKRDDDVVLIERVEKNNAIFIAIYGKGDTILTEECMVCSSNDIISGVIGCNVSKECQRLLEENKVFLLPASYDNFGVPVANRKCKCCGFMWHDEEVMRKMNGGNA